MDNVTADSDDLLGLVGEPIVAIVVKGFHVGLVRVDEPAPSTWLYVARYDTVLARFVTIVTNEGVETGDDLSVETEEENPRYVRVVIEERPADAFPVVPAGEAVVAWADGLLMAVEVSDE